MYGAVVVVAVVAGVDTSVLDALALVLIAARVVHTLVHVLFEQTTVVVSFRSAFCNVQWACMFIMALVIAAAAA